MCDVVAVAGPDGAQLVDVDGAVPNPTPTWHRCRHGCWGCRTACCLAFTDRCSVRIPGRAPSARHPRAKRRCPPTVLVDGLCPGVWRASDDAIEVRALEPLDDATLEQAGQRRRVTCDDSCSTGSPPCSPDSGGGGSPPDGPTITIGSWNKTSPGRRAPEVPTTAHVTRAP